VRAYVHLIPIYRGLDHREKPSAVVVNRKRARDEVGRKIGNGRIAAPGARRGPRPRRDRAVKQRNALIAGLGDLPQIILANL